MTCCNALTFNLLLLPVGIPPLMVERGCAWGNVYFMWATFGEQNWRWWGEPNVRIKRCSARSSDTLQGAGSFKQQDGGHGSRNPLRNV